MFAKNRKPTLLLLFAVVSTLGMVVLAGDDDDDDNGRRDSLLRHRWAIRGFVLQAEPDDAHLFTDDEAHGAGVSGEFRFSRLIGVEATLLAAGFDDDHYDQRHDDRDRHPHRHHDDDEIVGAALAGINFHLIPGSVVDFYLGPVLGVVGHDDYDWDYYHDHDHYHDDHDRYHRRHDGDAYAVGGINIGIDVAFGPSRNWVFHANIKKLNAIDDDDDHYHHHDGHRHLDNRDTDWEFLSLGVGYRF